MDDRSALFHSLQDFHRFQPEWRIFEDLTRLKTHESETQIWPRTAQIKTQLEQAGYTTKDNLHILGVTLGPENRKPSTEETNRMQEATALCRRITLLPGTMQLKRAVAQTVASSKASWGQMINGRCPTPTEVEAFAKAFDGATKSPQYPGGRASPALRRALFLGHYCNLAILGVQTLLRASSTWHKLQQPQVSWPVPHMRALKQVLEPMGWNVHFLSLMNAAGSLEALNRTCRQPCIRSEQAGDFRTWKTGASPIEETLNLLVRKDRFALPNLLMTSESFSKMLTVMSLVS